LAARRAKHFCRSTACYSRKGYCPTHWPYSLMNILVHNQVNNAIAFGLLVAIVGGSFYYVYALAPKGPWIGVTDGAFITPEAARAIGLQEQHGFLIFTIAPSSPAAKAGLQQADHEVSMDLDKQFLSAETLLSASMAGRSTDLMMFVAS
jgi:hypothetical protein